MNYICNYVYWRSRGKRGPACEAAIKLGIIERKWICELIRKMVRTSDYLHAI